MLTKEDFAKAFDYTVNKFLSVMEDKNYIIAPEVFFLSTDDPLLACVSTPSEPQNLTTKTFKEDFPNGVFVFRTKLPANWREAKYLISFEGCFLRGSQPDEYGIDKLSLFMRWAPSLLTERGKKEIVSLIGEDFYDQVTNKIAEFKKYPEGYEPDYRKNGQAFIDFVSYINLAMQSLVTPSV